MAHHHGARRIVWLLIGAAVGAGVALLYAPKSGKDTRRFIRRKTGDARDVITDAAESVREAYDTVAGAGREAYKKTAGVASGAADVFERGRKFMMG